MRLMFLHGRAQEGRDSVQLKREWEFAFERGLKAAGLRWPHGLEVVFPYYGDRLDRLALEVDAPLISTILHRGDAIVQPAEELRAALLVEMATGKAIPDAAIQRNFDGTIIERGAQNWKWIHAILRTLDGTPIGQNLLDRVTRDVSIYLSYPGIRLQIDELVNDEIPSGPSVYVAHSLGTVVAYNILRERADVQAPLLVTLGSPLGLKNIQALLDPPPKIPQSVEKWFNARDPNDVVALFPLDATHFPVTPSIENKSDVKNHTDNQHGSDGYLDDPVVAAKIHAALLALS